MMTVCKICYSKNGIVMVVLDKVWFEIVSSFEGGGLIYFSFNHYPGIQNLICFRVVASNEK